MAIGLGPHNVAVGRLRDELGRLLAEVRRGTDRVLDRPTPTPATLHRLHRDLRRVRVGLRFWRETLPVPQQARWTALDRRLRHLARLVGQVRDRDVAVDLLSEVTDAAESAEDRERLSRFRTRLRDDAGIGRELLRAALRAARDGGLFDELEREVTAARASAAGRTFRLERLLTRHRADLHAKVARAHRRARRRPSTDRLHRLRIRVRRLRQLADLESALEAAGAVAVTRPLRRLQEDLGRLHDLDVLWLRLDPSLRATRWARALRRERRDLRREVLALLDRSRPKRAALLAPAPLAAAAVT